MLRTFFRVDPPNQLEQGWLRQSKILVGIRACIQLVEVVIFPFALLVSYLTVRSTEELILSGWVDEKFKLIRNCKYSVFDCEGVEWGVHNDRGKNDDEDEKECGRPEQQLVPWSLSELFDFEDLGFALWTIQSGVDIFKFHPMEERKRCRSCCPVRYLFKLPQEGNSCEK